MSSAFKILLVVVVTLHVHAESIFARSIADDLNEMLVNSGRFKVDLIHPDSPSLHNSIAFTRLERLQRGIRRSKSRAKYLAAKHSERIGLASKDGQSSLFSAYEEYNMEFELGTPPVKVQAIMDTGSDLVWVQCKPCKHCYKQQVSVFSPKNSSSYSLVPCANAICGDLGRCESGRCIYEYVYADASSTTGELALDAISMQTTSGSTQKVGNIVFGCGHKQLGDFGEVGGVVGLGQGPASLVSQLSSPFQKMLSYCMVNFDDAPTSSSLMHFGASAKLKGSGIKTTPLVQHDPNPTLYYVNVEGISVAGERAAISHESVRTSMENRTIIDSGTTFTLLTPKVYSGLKSLMRKHVSLPTFDGSDLGFDLCYNRDLGHMDYKFPSLTFHFTNADVELPFGNYFVSVNEEGTHVCFVMLSSDDTISIIGNLQQQNFHVFYDVGGAQLSFQPTICWKAEG